MSNGSVTSGYDAVMAITQTKLNLALFAQYAANFPGEADFTLSAVVANPQANYYVVNFALDTPYLSFPTGSGQDAQLQMFVGPGSYMLSIDLFQNPALQYGVSLAADTSMLSGSFPLNQISGSENSLGQVTLSLGGSQQWIVDVNGIDSTSSMATSIATALQTYFQNLNWQLNLGTVMIPANLQACLTPKRFSIQSFPSVESTDGLLAFLIVTSGSGGNPLQSAPVIPAGSDVAIYLSGADVANGLIAPALATNFPGSTWQANLNNAPWTLNCASGSSFSMGSIDAQESPYVEIFSGCMTGHWTPQKELQNIEVPLSGLEFSSNSDNQLTVAYNSTSWSQDFTTIDTNQEVTQTTNSATITASGYANTFSVQLSGGENTFQFETGTPTPPTVNVSSLGTWGGSIDQVVLNQMASSMANALESIQLPGVNEFLLTTLVSPSGTINLTAGSLPYDLVTTGAIEATVPVSPQTIVLGQGQSATFTATPGGGNESVQRWHFLAPAIGVLTPNGNTATYTAPAVIPGDRMFVLQAIVNSTTIGYSIIRLSPTPVPNAISFQPVGVFVPVNGSCYFNVNDTASGSLTVTSTPPNLVQAMGGNEFVFQAPSTPGPVTITATDGTNTNTTVYQVVGLDTSMAISPASGAANWGGTANFSATSDLGGTVNWVLVPEPSGSDQGLGTLSATTGSSVVYTAPTQGANSSLNLWIVAYTLATDTNGNPTSFAFAKAMITVSNG